MSKIWRYGDHVDGTSKCTGRAIRCVANSSYTISFNANGGSGTMNDQEINPGESTSLSANSFTAPAMGQSYQNASGTTIPGTTYTLWRFNGWNTAADGSGTSYTDEQVVTDIASSGDTITLYAQWQGIETMKVNFQGNDLSFSDSSTTNTVYYYNNCSTKYVSTPQYSHTANVSDAGVQNGSYAHNLATKDVVTVSGADYLHVTLTYGTEANWDYLYVFQGEYTGNVSKNMSAGQLATYNGGSNTTTTVTLDIPGDKATFAFYSDSSNAYYGYYAVVEGYYDTAPGSYDHTTSVCNRTLVAGEYKTPTTNSHQAFRGWSESSSATTATYTSADDVLDNLSGNNSETKNLYAVYDDLWIMTFVNTNGGATKTKNVVQGNSTTVAPSSSFSRSNYKLKGWDTNSAGTTVVYTNGQSITPSSDMTFYTVWTPTYTINYNINTSDANATGTMGTHTNVGENDQVTLYASNFSRTNYGFAGWSFDSTAQPGGSATIYGPNETITAPAPTTPGETKTLYAVWVQSAGNIQNWVGCSSMSVGQVTALKDLRDNQVYAVAKLADDNCWMIENLRLEAAGTTGNNINDSSVTNESLAQGYGKSTTYGDFSGLATAETSNFSNSTTANSLYYSGTQSGTASVNIGTSDYPGYRMPRYRNSNTSSRASNATGTGNTYSYGNYYTWSAAMANTIYYSSATATDSDGKTSETVETSICPVGWKLPYGRSSGNGATSGGFYNLNYIINNNSDITDSTASNNLRTYPNNFLYSGNASASAVASRGSQGNYWSSTAYDYSRSYGLALGSSNVSPSSLSYKYLGFSIRCLASNGYDITLNGNGATTAGSASTKATYGQGTLNTITNPSRSYTISGFTGPAGNNADGATISSNSTLTSNYTFNGWYKESGATNLIASNATTPVLQANTDYTDSNGNWNYNSGVTLYAGWTGQSKTLPTITRNGYSCGWTETPTGATSIQYASGSSLTPSSNITLYGVCICPAGSICYDDNGANSSTTMGLQSVASNATSVDLWASNFKRSNYGFAGWNTAADGSGTNYGPNETIDNTTTLNTIKNNGLRLYAKWIASAGNLQGWTGCSSMSTGQVTALKDTRDNDVYAVAKLADGNCWMIENLRLDYDANITTANTQSNNGAFGGVFSGLAEPETANFDNVTTANSLYKSDGSGDIKGVNGATLSDIGTTNSPGYRMPRYHNDNTNTNSTINPNTNISNMTDTDQNIYSYGNYYTWAAALANTNYYDSPTATDGNGKTSETAGTSLCPTGWKLPRGGNKTRIEGGTSDFYTLGLAIVGTAPANYSSTTTPYWAGNTEGINASKVIRTYPNNFLYSGYVVNSSVSYRGSNGRYWSSTAASSNGSYALSLDGPNPLYQDGPSVYPGTNNDVKSRGRSIRCLISTEYTISYNANGGSGTMSNQTAAINSAVNLNPNSFTPPSGKVFDSWNTAPDGSGTSYADEASVTNLTSAGSTIALYAQWKKLYLQEVTTSQCSALASSANYIAYDKRDEKDYTIRFINGMCWMTQNLRFKGTSLNSSTSNVQSTYTISSPLTISYGDLTSGSSNTKARIVDSGSTSTGVWYNFAAASAMSIASNSSTTTASYSICPKNWHLPTGPSTTAGTDYNMLIGNTTSGFQSPTAGLSLFSPVSGGFYNYFGSLGSTRYGYWWSATAEDSTTRYYLYYDSNNGSFSGDGWNINNRGSGRFVRCVRTP